MRKFFWQWLMVITLASVASVVLAQSWDTLPRLPDHYQKRLAAFNKEKTKTGKLLFLGNSITEGGNWKKLTGDSASINRGISGDVTFGVLRRLDEVTKHQPAKIFLLIGVNDLAKGIPEDVIIGNILTIARNLRARVPNAQVLVQSLLPVNPSFKNFPKGYDRNESIATINEQLRKAAERYGYTFVDIHSGFSDVQGLLLASYSTDGLHLSAAGYQRWAAILKEAKHF
jgi:lysophospholipase L1-like esterase